MQRNIMGCYSGGYDGWRRGNYEMREKGNGFLETVCQKCLAIEFTGQCIPFIEKPRQKQTYEPDFLCFGEIIPFANFTYFVVQSDF